MIPLAYIKPLIKCGNAFEWIVFVSSSTGYRREAV